MAHGQYIDSHTRAVMVDVVVYSAMLDRTCYLRFLGEITAVRACVVPIVPMLLCVCKVVVVRCVHVYLCVCISRHGRVFFCYAYLNSNVHVKLLVTAPTVQAQAAPARMRFHWIMITESSSLRQQNRCICLPTLYTHTWLCTMRETLGVCFVGSHALGPAIALFCGGGGGGRDCVYEHSDDSFGCEGSELSFIFEGSLLPPNFVAAE